MLKAKSLIDSYLLEGPYDRVRPDLIKGLRSLRIPRFLYHLTPRSRLPLVLKKGLKVKQKHSGGLDIGSDFEQLGIYLSSDSKEVLLNTDIHNPSQLTIDSTKLDRSKFELDPEFYYDDAYDDPARVIERLKSGDLAFFLVYKQDIPLEALVKVDRKYFDPDLMDFEP